MKCQNCNSELLEGAKFCTPCGTPVAAQPAGGVCGKCGARLLSGAKFCTTCGAPAAAAPESAPAPEARAAEGGELAAVKQKIFWNIQKGEVACRVNESEFVSYDSAQGLIVNDGTTAYIKANGKVLAEIHGGIYDFVDPDELERILESRRGGAAGALATWLFYRPHFDLEESPDTIRGVFCTAPAVRNPASNLLSEIIATFVLIFTIFYITEGHLASTEGNVPIGLGSVGALPVALVILVIGGALGGTTGYSLNPARDLSPRIVHALVPIRHKGGSDWRYAWIASVGPLLGALLAAGVQVMIRS